MSSPTWQSDCGRVRLFLGDCHEVIPHLGDVDVVVSDPPYEITAAGGSIAAKRDYLKRTIGFTDCGFDYGMLDRFDNWSIFGTLRQLPKLITAAADRRWMLVTWNKPDPAPLCNGNYLPDTEYIVHAWRKGNLFGDCTEKARFILRPSNRDNGYHPNCKPIDVMEKVVVNAADVGGVVLDPFMGSGTTGIACLRKGRRFIGIEREPAYFEIAKRRIQEAMGYEVKRPDGLTQRNLFALTPTTPEPPCP